MNFAKWAALDVVNALKAMGAAKSRTALATLGIVIGVMSVLAVSSIGASAQALVVGQVTSFGGDLIGIIPGGSQEDGPPPIAFGIVVTTLTRGDIEAIGRLEEIAAASAYILRTETVAYKGDGIIASVYGVSETMPAVEAVDIRSGRFFDRSDVESFGRVAVIGPRLASRLDPDADDLVGQRIRIGGTTFTVIGQTAPRGSSFFQDQDEVVYVPITTAQRLIAGIDYVNAGRARVKAGTSVSLAKEAVKTELRRRHNIRDPAKDDFSIRSTDQAAAILGGVTGAVKGFLIAVTAISLLVGGVNVMNVMYVAVKERTREIGLRKSLGANKRRILFQFLVESATISSIGGATGILLGVALTSGVASAISAKGYDWDFIMPSSAIVQAFVLSTSLGIVFGVSPALTAAGKDPIAALRDE